MYKLIEYVLSDEQATQDVGKLLAGVCSAPLVIFLQGPLGAGKTTLVRAMLQQLGVEGPIKSPTFTLVEPYHLAMERIFHFDLYRLQDPDELEYIGLRDYFANDSICLIEWPEKGQPYLPSADLSCELSLDPRGRLMKLYAYSENAKAALQKLIVK